MRKAGLYTIGFFLFGCYQSAPITLEVELDGGIDGGIAIEKPFLPDSLELSTNPPLIEVAEAAMMVYLLWQRARCVCHHGHVECPWGLAESVNPEATKCLAESAKGDDDHYLWLYEIATRSPRYLSCTAQHEICPQINSGGRCDDHEEREFAQLFGGDSSYKYFVKDYNRCVKEHLKMYK